MRKHLRYGARGLLARVFLFPLLLAGLCVWMGCGQGARADGIAPERSVLGAWQRQAALKTVSGWCYYQGRTEKPCAAPRLYTPARRRAAHEPRG